jgi:hypothetical protein
MNIRKRTAAHSVDSVVTCAGGRGLDRAILRGRSSIRYVSPAGAA